jgi:TonB family protein
VSKQYQSHIIAFFGTLFSLCLILLLLWFLKLTAPVYEEEEGIIVSFGNAEEGGGMPDVSHIDEITQVEQIPMPSLPTLPSDNDFIVQEDEESLALKKQTVEEEANRKAEEEALKRRRKEEEARAEAERIAREKALAEKKAKEQEAIENANQFAALFGQAGTTEGANGENEATNATSGMGNPSGKGYGSIDNATWTLQGRNCRHIPKPSEEFNQTGRVVVNIIVDLEGNVTSASVGDGSNISDRETQRLALESARNAKFSKGETTQRGTIVYIFTDKKITK